MSWELYLPPVRPNRNRRTGRFLKGCTPANKGKTWDEYMPKRSQKRCAKGWKNLNKYRPKERPDNAGRSRKKCVLLSDKGNFLVFEYIGAAAEWLNGSRENISRCCRQNAARHANRKTGRTNTDHKYMGYRWYFYSDQCWFDKVGVGI